MKPQSHPQNETTSGLRHLSFVIRHCPLLAALGLTLGSLHAQTPNVPPFMNYQGRVTGAGGVGLGDPTPVARKVVFRLFAAPSGGSTLWTEEQTVTLSKGDFSVLLGLGIVFGAEPRDPLDTVFTGDRYLEITVDNGDGTINGSDTPILPRQRITSTAYSFRAKTADSVVGGSIGTTSLADTSVTLAKMASGSVSSTAIVNGSIIDADLADGSVTLNKLAASSVNSSKIVDATIATADLADASVTKTKLGADVGVWDIASGNVYRSTGNVGIGTTAPAAKLDLSSATSGAIERLRISGNDYIGSGNSTAGVSLMLLRNIANRADLFIGYSGALASSATNAGLRIIPGGQNNGITQIDAIATDGAAAKDLGINVPGGKVSIGAIADAGHSALSVTSSGQFQLDLGGTGGTASGKMMRLGYNQTGDYAEIMSVHSGIGFKNLVLLGSGGNVGIGTPSPTQGKLVVIGGISNRPNSGQYSQMNNSTTLFLQSAGAGGQDVSIYGSHTIWAGVSVCSSSDARIKELKGISSSAADLTVLQQIQVADYIYKDKLAHGSAPQKKVIAQQVEKVYPLAVTQRTDIVPDIFKPASIKNGWVHLSTELKKGDRVSILGDKTTDVFEVLEVAEGKFRIAFKPEGDKVFVYGREVKDFRTVDYDAISMLNVSATQELARKVEALEKANAEKDTALTAMTQRLAALEAKDKARDAKLAGIEAMLSGDKPAALPVSLKKSVGGAE